MWQQNLINNLITVSILFSLFVIIYCKVKDITALEFFKEIKEILSPSEALDE